VNLWIDNTEHVYNYWKDSAKEAYRKAKNTNLENKKDEAVYSLAEEMKNYYHETMPQISGVFGDLMNSALQEVNWHEIAKIHVENFIEVEA
jgi:hypothetical protein